MKDFNNDFEKKMNKMKKQSEIYEGLMRSPGMKIKGISHKGAMRSSSFISPDLSIGKS